MLGAATFVAACGGAPSTHVTTGAGVGPTATPAATSSPTATPSPTPPPPPPLAVISDDAGIHAVYGSGAVRWTVPQATIDTLTDKPHVYSVTIATAGPNVVVSALTSNPAPSGRVAVIGSTGAVLYKGTFTGAGGNGAVHASPDGTQWAWSVDATPASTGAHHGSIVVAGLTTAPHVVYSWLAPVGATEEVGAWTDMGIVMERLISGGCGPGFHPDSASFLVDPVAGTLSDLFSGGQHYADARRGTRVAYSATSESEVLVNGVAFDESGAIALGAYVSTDGASVAIARLTPGGCGGTPVFSTELVTVASGQHSDVAGCRAEGWFDATHFVGAKADGSLSVFDLSGAAGVGLGNGSFVGALQPA